jgi:hypothetical protein
MQRKALFNMERQDAQDKSDACLSPSSHYTVDRTLCFEGEVETLRKT